ncbi:MAG: glutamate--tRNA ligase [Fidelibacterota bacterium]
MSEIRTRFAPSPTGYLHVGGLRTALYNYLFAKQNNGKFILRIEDTDQNRKVENAVENLIDSLQWAGLEIDEGKGFGGDYGPYVQSERTELYRKHVQELLDKGEAYPCFCSAERLAKVKEETPNSGYDGHCRILSKEKVNKKIAAGEPYVVRQKVPAGREVVFYDIVRGKVTFASKEIDDQVLLKSDGFPTYHLANVVDDHYMKISHVVRGEEWLISTPKHILLYESFGWKPPKFAHLSLLLNSDKSKLSKRQGDVSVEDYREKGYLREALINFLALLGWNPGNDEELFTMKQLIKKFSLKKVSKSGSIFDVEKLNWMNGQYIRDLSDEEFIKRAKPFFPKDTGLEADKITAILQLFKARIERLDEIPVKVAIFTSEFPPLEEKAEKALNDEMLTVLKFMARELTNIENFSGKAFVDTIKKAQKETGVKGKNLWMSARIGISGQEHGAEIHLIADILGKELCIKRINHIINEYEA